MENKPNWWELDDYDTDSLIEEILRARFDGAGDQICGFPQGDAYLEGIRLGMRLHAEIMRRRERMSDGK